VLIFNYVPLPRGINIAKADKLIGLAEAVGLPGREAAEVMNTMAFREAVDSDCDLVGQLGISAAPTFVLDYWAVVGTQPYEVLEKLLLDNGVKRRAS